MARPLYKLENNAQVYFFNVEELAKKYKLRLETYGSPADTQNHGNRKFYLTNATFSNKYKKRRKQEVSIEVVYYMNRMPKSNKWVAGQVYSLEVCGIKLDETKDWGGLFPDIPSF